MDQTFNVICSITPRQALALVQKTPRSERLSCPRIHSQSVAEQDSNQHRSHLIQRNRHPGRLSSSARASARPELGAGQAQLVTSLCLLLPRGNGQLSPGSLGIRRGKLPTNADRPQPAG